jgi:hypothetical protein
MESARCPCRGGRAAPFCRLGGDWSWQCGRVERAVPISSSGALQAVACRKCAVHLFIDVTEGCGHFCLHSLPLLPVITVVINRIEWTAPTVCLSSWVLGIVVVVTLGKVVLGGGLHKECGRVRRWHSACWGAVGQV